MNTTYTLAPGACLFHADCRDALRVLPDNSLDSCVTDPPYALVSIVKRFGSPNAAPAKGNDAYMRASAGFMGKTWDTGEVAFSAEFWAEVLRVLKPGAHLVAFGASRGYHRMTCAIEDAGFEIRDSLMWLYGTGFPKSHDVSKGMDREAGAERVVTRAAAVADDERPEHIDMDPRSSKDRERRDIPATAAAAEWEGWGTALKPAFEPIVLARKPLSESTVAANVLRWRTGALNIDACRIGNEGGTRGATAGPSNGILGDGLNGKFGTPVPGLGRWPANVLHDGSDEVVAAFPASPGQIARSSSSSSSSSDSRRNQNVYGDMRRGAPGTEMQPRGDTGSAARFFYSAKASKADRAGSKHPTVKPIALKSYLAQLITPPGGTILDPFAGSGTTGAAAVACGFNVILCEREPDYVRDIRARFGYVDSPPVAVE